MDKKEHATNGRPNNNNNNKKNDEEPNEIMIIKRETRLSTRGKRKIGSALTPIPIQTTLSMW